MRHAILIAIAAVVAWAGVADARAQGDPVTEGLTGTADSARELLENIPDELPAGVDVRIRAEPMTATERSIYGTAGAAELTAALLLRGNPGANQALAKATQELGSRPIRLPARPVVTRGSSKLLRRLGMPGKIASLVANLGALKGLASPQRLRALGSRLGTFGRFSTRQILYAHGTYSSVASVTGYKARVDVTVSEDMIPIAPETGPMGKPVVTEEVGLPDTPAEAPTNVSSEAVVPVVPVVPVAPEGGPNGDANDAVAEVQPEVQPEPQPVPRAINPDDPPEPKTNADEEWILDSDPLGAVRDVSRGVEELCDPSTGCER